MGKKTDKLIFDVESQLHLTKVALKNYVDDVRIATKDKEFDTGVSMGALLKQIATEDPKRAAKIKADADKLWETNSAKIGACIKDTQKELSYLSDYVAKKKSARKLPWSSTSVTKSEKFIKDTDKFLDGIPKTMAGLKTNMMEAAEIIEGVSKQFGHYHDLASSLKKETKDQSEE